MFRISCPVLACAVLTALLSVRAVQAQVIGPGPQPDVDLTSSLDTGPYRPAFNPISPRLAIATPAPQDDKLFNDPAPAEGGWQGLANLLEALTPDVDTSLPLTASQITDRISRMLDQGQSQEALAVIEKRQAQLQNEGGMGTDVQLLFLHGRALAAVARNNEAIDVYLHMTTLYPELPEPWNNLASEYVKQGKLEMAEDALSMALAANPNYGTARANLAEVQLMLAHQSYQEAAALGVDSAKAKASQAARLLQE